MVPRIGYAGNFIAPDGALDKTVNQRRTTVHALSKLTYRARLDRVKNIVRHNLVAFAKLLARLGEMPPHQRFVRIGSDLLPAYLHDESRKMYDNPELRKLIRTECAAIGELARSRAVRLSMHTEVSLVSLARAVGTVDYHATILSLMGYSGWHQATVSVALRGGDMGDLQRMISMLSASAREFIAIENDDKLFDIERLLPLASDLPIVLNLQNHWLSSGGTYIGADDPTIARINGSWRGARPYGRLSLPREGLPNTTPNGLPSLSALLAEVRPADVRSRSELLWNHAVNDWACKHLGWMDIEVEARHANRAAQQLIDHAVLQSYILPNAA